MLRIFGIVAAIVRPGALPIIAVDVLHPGRPRLLGENHVARLQHRPGEARRHTIEVTDHGSMVLDEHRGYRVELRREVEERKGAQGLTPTGNVDLVAIDVAHRVHEWRVLEVRVAEGERAFPVHLPRSEEHT